MKNLAYCFTRLIMMCLLLAVFSVFLTPKTGYAEIYVHPNVPQNQATRASSQQGTQDQDIMGKIASKYQQKAEAWASGLTNFAERLFKAFLIIDIVMFAFSAGFGIANGGKTLGTVFAEFALYVFLPAGFMFCVLHYYQPWSQQIVDGLSYIAGSVEPKSAFGSTHFFVAGTTIFDAVYNELSLTDTATWASLIVGILILICYALMAMRILMIKCESYIVLNAGIIILGLGAFNQTRSYAVNFIRYVLAVAIKLYVMQLIIGIAFSFVDDFLKTTTEMSDLSVVLGASIVMLGLINSIPEMCASIISGSAGSSGSSLGSAVGAAAGAAMGAGGAVAGFAVGAAGVPAAVKAAASAADAAGKTGFGKAASMAGMMLKAGAGASIGQSNPENSFSGRFASKLSQRAMNSKIKSEE